MTPAVLLTITALAGVSPAAVPGDTVVVVPYIRQGFLLQRSTEVMVGGAGGGFGGEMVWADRYLVDADVSALWLIGNAVSARIAVGIQRRGAWNPAGWLTAVTVFGDRLELLNEDGGHRLRDAGTVDGRRPQVAAVGMFAAFHPGS